MTPKTLFAVVVGAGVGAVAAVSLRNQPPLEPKPNLAPVAARPLEVAPKAESELRAQPGLPETAAAPAVAPGGSASSAAPAAIPAAVEDDLPIASKEEFQAAAVACDEKDAGACRRAARAAELGDVVRKDPKRAKTFRLVELTALVRGCEKSSVAACLTLADRYLRGDLVERNERTATALIEHAKELCARRPDPACPSVPAN